MRKDNPVTDRAERLEDCILMFADAETYYDKDYSLSKMTTEAYIRDPRFEVIMFNYQLGNEPMVTLTGTTYEIGVALSKLPWHKICFVAHNAAFDASIISYIWRILPRFVLCTERMAAPFLGNVCSLSLKSLAEYFSLPPKGDAVHNMMGKRRSDMSPQTFAEYVEYCKHDTWLCRELFFRFLPHLPYEELYSLHATLMMTAHPTLQLDPNVLTQMLADEHQQRVNIYDRVREMLAPTATPETIKSILASNDKFPKLLEALGVEVPTKVNAKGETKFALAKTDPGMEEMLHCDDVLIRTLCEARLITKSTQAESRAQRFLDISKRGAMPFPVKWCGADVTHRWSATDGINTQNLRRGGALRKAIVAPKGYKLIVADLSQIELRFGWWLAGEWDKLAAFAEGFDPYKAIYAKTFGLDPDSIEKGSVERQCGKVVQLSGIFGTGAKKVRHTIRIQAGKTISESDADALIQTYRRDHPHVVNAWSVGEQAIEALHADVSMPLWQPGFAVVSSKESPFGIPGIRKPDGMIMSRPGVDFQWGRWPSGDPKREWFYQRRKGRNFIRDYIYGGKVFQSATQSGARDIMSGVISRVARALPYGCSAAGTAHDELIGLAPENKAEQIAALFRTEMTRPVPWAPNLPLAVDVQVGDVYGEIK